MDQSTTRGRRRVGAAKAALLAVVILVPALGLLVDLMADQPLAVRLSLYQKVLSALVFAGLPGALAFAGIGARLASKANTQSVAATMRIGAVKGALVGLALGLLVAVPVGALPQSVAAWVPLLTASAGVAALTGAFAGLWIAGRTGSTRKAENVVPSA